MLLGAGPFVTWGGRRLGWRRFQPTGRNGGPGLLPLENGNFVTELLNGFLQHLDAVLRRLSQLLNFLLQGLDALLLRLEDGQQSVHEGRSFGGRDRGKNKLHAN